MKKTLLIVFIHGFKGDSDTFGSFPQHVRQLTKAALPAVDVITAVYPKYETRGYLKECVGRFREWLQNMVIDLEVANRAASPTVDPSVHVFLVGHSMGGIVAAETLLLLSSERPIAATPPLLHQTSIPYALGHETADENRATGLCSFMFPHVQGVLTFDTPYLGMAPGVVSYGAEGYYKSITSAYNTLSGAANALGVGRKESSHSSLDAKQQILSPLRSPGTASTIDAAAIPSWQRWGRYAMFAGAAGAVAAGGAAAMYSQRQRITDGVSWVSSHLAFVGCLARTQELHERLSLLSNVLGTRGIRCTNFYTCLRRHTASIVDNTNSTSSLSQQLARSNHRSFCILPGDIAGPDHISHVVPGVRWIQAVNDKAANEVTAHISMFLPNENPGFNTLATRASDILVDSIDRHWYSTASKSVDEVIGTPQRSRDAKLNIDCKFMGEDDMVFVD